MSVQFSEAATVDEILPPGLFDPDLDVFLTTTLIQTKYVKVERNTNINDPAEVLYTVWARIGITAAELGSALEAVPAGMRLQGQDIDEDETVLDFIG